MSVSLLVADIAENVRNRLSLPTYTTTTKITTARLLAQVQQSYRSLAALTRQKLGRDYDLLATATLATQANLNMVSLPTNCGEVVKVLWVKDTTHAPQLSQAMASDYEPMGFNPRAWDQPSNAVPYGYGGALPKYDMEGATLVFYPCPNQVYTVAIWYTLHYPVITLSDTIQGRLDWDLWLALDVAMALCSDLKRDPSVYAAEKAQLETNLFAAKRQRDMSAVQTIRDVNNENLRQSNGWWGGF